MNQSKPTMASKPSFASKPPGIGSKPTFKKGGYSAVKSPTNKEPTAITPTAAPTNNINNVPPARDLAAQSQHSAITG